MAILESFSVKSNISLVSQAICCLISLLHHSAWVIFSCFLAYLLICFWNFIIYCNNNIFYILLYFIYKYIYFILYIYIKSIVIIHFIINCSKYRFSSLHFKGVIVICLLFSNWQDYFSDVFSLQPPNFNLLVLLFREVQICI